MLEIEDALDADLKLYDSKIESIIEGTFDGGIRPKPKMQ